MRSAARQSVDEFHAGAEPLYCRDPTRHTVELTTLRNLAAGSVLLTVTDADHTVGAALQTPLFPMLR